MKCAKTGVTCEMNFKPRSMGFFNRSEPQVDMVEGVVIDFEGTPKFKLEGCFSDRIWGYPVGHPE